MLSLRALLLFACAASIASAEIVTYIGTDFDTAARWRTASTNKGSVAGSTVVGQDGYFLIANVSGAKITSNPSYISSLTSNVSIYCCNNNYQNIDDPRFSDGTIVRSGTLNPNTGGTNNSITDLTFVIGASAPTSIRLAVMIDNTDGAGYTPNAISIVQTVGGSASATANTSTSISANYENKLGDLVYFTLQGAVQGDTFAVVANGGPSSCGCVTALAFDTVAATAAPEPSTYGMAVIAILAVYPLRRRLRRT